MGVAICERLAQDGASVAVLDLNYEAAQTVAKRLEAGGFSALAAAVDVSDRGQVDGAVGVVRQAFGPIHILVNSAGIADFVPFLSLTEDQWDRMIAVNLKGTFNIAQAVVGDMVAAGWGRIILISSSGAQSGAARQAHYIASKAGVIGFTKSLALEFGPAGITVNTVPPGGY
jgi:NAD(P)-dependent dehydrogenase (short-subunit alcohol dehydrogenase family)